MKTSTRTVAHKVYRCYDEADRLIYVGMTSLPLARRFDVHEHKNPRVSADTVRVESTDYPDRISAAEAEGRAIDTERPLYNIRRGAAWEPTEDELREAASLVFGVHP